jgi:serine/threonine-protein kinase
MAVVWKARQLSLDRTVAIKVLSSHLSADAEDIERFKLEAQAEAKLKHNGIVQVYDANVEAGSCYIVQEYVNGYSVGDWVRRKGQLSEEDALLVAGYVCDALAYAWETAGVIHCDIKPDNILIDADGTPKITDLGLARTISAMTEDTVSNEVMGTPAYMSPEQIEGLPDLDCRSDIYSLGAMLYHCVTGRMLFQGESDESVMENQLEGAVPAPHELNPDLSSAICGLIEKMLAKDREDRYPDWEAVRADIVRAKRGLPPHEPLDQSGLSTAKHTSMPLVVHSPTVRRQSRRSSGGGRSQFMSLLLTLVAAGAGVVGGLWAYNRLMERVSPQQAEPLKIGTAVVPDGPSQAERLLGQARRWRIEHPEDFAGVERRYRRVLAPGAGTEFARQASDELDQVVAEREQAIQDVMNTLDHQVAPLVRQEQLLEAARAYVAYDGRAAVDTAELRAQRAAQLRTRHEDQKRREHMAEVEQREWINGVLDSVVNALLSEGVGAGLQVLRTASGKATDEAHATSLSELEALLVDAGDTDAEIVESFAVQVGQVVDVEMKTGTRKVKIMGVVDGMVHARLVTSVNRASVELRISLHDLAASERLARMGHDNDPDVALAKGMMAWQAGSMDYARRFFGQTDERLADRLVAAVNKRAEGDKEDQAQSALFQLLRSLGIPLEGPYSRELALVSLRSIRMDASDVDRVVASVERYHQQYGSSEFARENAIVLKTVSQLADNAELRRSRSGTGIKSTDGLTDDVVVDALRKANPGLAQHEIEIERSDGRRITRIEIASDSLRDIAPLGACADLTTLILSCPSLEDLASISRLPLTALSLVESDVQDLIPLRQMPLTELVVESAPVRDLSALRGKALTSLSVAHTRVGTLHGLTGMPLKSLDVSGTFVKRLDFLKGMPLEKLLITNTKVNDLSPLRLLPLRHLDASGTMIRDLAFANGSQIEHLDIARTPINSLSGLRQSRISTLNASGTRLRSLKGIEQIDNLGHLNISDTSVSDIEPLRGLPLRSLSIDNTPVENLGVLRSLPLVHLSCRNLGTSDYSALKGLRIESISIADLASVGHILQTMPNLKKVNGLDIRGDGQEEGAEGARLQPAVAPDVKLRRRGRRRQ